jgi:dipeptidase E
MNQPKNLKIMAIGGKTPDGRASELLRQGVELTGKEHGSNVLVIPTAKLSAESQASNIARTDRLFSERLGLPNRTLHEFNQMPSEHIVDELLEWADLVYISGGDTKRMMEVWQRYGIDSKLRVRAIGGLVLTGISAGAVAPFKWGHSDWRHYHTDGEWEYEPVNALGLINAAITPHGDSIENGVRREDEFKKMFWSEGESRGTRVGFAIDNFAGIKIHDGSLELKTAADRAGATLLDTRTGEPLSSRLDANQPIALSELGL